MKIFAKFLLSMALLIVTAGTLDFWYRTFLLGRYYESASAFMTALGVLTPFVVIGIACFAGRAIFKMPLGIALIAAIGLTAGCARGSANVQTLVSNDCGVSWELIPPGKIIPARIGPCAYKVTIPDYPLQGETKFKTSFKNRVLASVEIAYEYSIFDGRVFIGEAKYLGKANSDVDDATNASSAYESAENAVIDKRIRETTTEMLINEDIVEFSQGEFEDALLVGVNERLKDKGVRLNFISFVPTPEEQTRLAIDMMTAMKVYESKGLGDLGKAVATARAGAPHIQMQCGSVESTPDSK